MPFALQPVDDGVELTLNGRVGVQHAAPLWEALQEGLADETVFRVNAAELEEMDTSIVQILCLLSATPGKLRVTATSDGFVLSLKQRGLANLFVDPPAWPVGPTVDETVPFSDGTNQFKFTEIVEEGIPA